MTYTAASQQGAIKMFWLHYGELSGCPSFIQSMVYKGFISPRFRLYLAEASLDFFRHL